MQQFLAGRLAAIAEHNDTKYVEFYRVEPVDGHVAFDALWGSSNPEEVIRYSRPITNQRHQEYVRSSARNMGFDVATRDNQVEPYPEALHKMIAAYGFTMTRSDFEQGQSHLQELSFSDPYRSLDEYVREQSTHRLQTVWNLYCADVKSRVDVLKRSIGEATRWPMSAKTDAQEYAHTLGVITGLSTEKLADSFYSLHLDKKWDQPESLGDSLSAVKQGLLTALHEA